MTSESGSTRVNLGCGPTPTPGWINIDNSLSVRLARMPVVSTLIGRGAAGRKTLVDATKEQDIRYGTALKTGLGTGSTDVVYTSHMLEHLDRREARLFLAEALRILRPGGILRVVVPDLKMIVDKYQEDGDADRFMESLFLDLDKPNSVAGKAKFAFLTGFRLHHWMYDARSLKKLLLEAGFSQAVELPAGETTIRDPGELDLREREIESIYIEAVRP